MFHATRRRLAIWYTTVTAVLLLVFAIGVYFYVRNTLIERVDDTLLHVVEVVERNLVIEPDPLDAGKKLHINVEASFRDNVDSVEDDRIDLEWFNPTGELLWSTFSAPLNIPIHFNRTGETVQILDKNGDRTSNPNHAMLLRQITQRVQVGRQVLGYLRVSHPWFEVTKPVQQLAIDLGIGTGLMVFSVALCGWFLSGKAMKPVLLSYQQLKQFTADASHELRSPITLIQTNIQVALAEPELNLPNSAALQYRQNLKVLERLTKRLGRLVDDLLFLARQDSGIIQPQLTDCPLDALLMEVVEEQQLLAKEKNIALSLEIIEPTQTDTTPEQQDRWFTLSGDWNQLGRLFTNLIENALNYSSAGDRVQVKLQKLATSLSEIPSLRTPPGAWMQIKIIDTGIGISQTDLPRLFDRFYRVDPARTHTNNSSSGLGLAIASAIVLNHQGQIHATSIIQQGTTFTVNLPVLIEPSKSNA